MMMTVNEVSILINCVVEKGFWVYPEFCVNVLRECKQQKLV